MSYASLADNSRQYAENWEVARQENFRLNRAIQTKNEVDVPVILWDDKYQTQPKTFIDLLRRVSDYQLLNPHPLYQHENPNQAYLMDVVKGKLRMEDYYAIDNIYGEAGVIPTRDNHFFQGARSALMGQILQHPFQFTTKQINTTYARKQIEEDSKKGAKILMQSLLDVAKNSGKNLDFARDKSVEMPTDENQLLKMLNGQEQIELIIYKLLQHVDNEHSYQNLGRKAFSNKFDVNAQFAFMNVVNGELVPKHYHPDQVRWMATRRVETFEDPNVLAASVMDYMTPTELINEYGVGLQTGTGIQGIVRYIDSLTKHGNRIGYDPAQNYWSDQGVSSWGLGSNMNNLEIQGYTQKQINWMNRVFYPLQRSQRGLLMNVLVQRNFVKVIREKRYRVERIESNGLRRPATDRELKAWQESDFLRELELDFVPIDETKKEDLSRANVKTYHRTELFGFDRIGHDSFINVGPYKFSPKEDGNESTGYVGMPIVAQISYEKSMAKLGELDAIRANVLYRLVDEFMANMGYSEAIVIDDAQEGEPIEYLYNARKSGVARMDSTLMQPNNQAQLRHLQTIKLSNQTEELQVAFAMIRQIQTNYESRVGLSPQVQGISEKYDGLRETQLNIANQQLLLTECIYEHTQFMNQCLQRSADILKILFARKGQKNIVLSDGERELLELTIKLALADFDVRLESGMVIENRLKLIQTIVQSMAASGGAAEGEALLAVSMTRNPAEAQAIYRQLRERIEEREKAASQQQAQASQQMAEIEIQKLQIQLQKEQMITDREKMIQEMKMQEKQQLQDIDGQKKDVQETNEREKMVLDAQLEQKNQQAKPTPSTK